MGFRMWMSGIVNRFRDWWDMIGQVILDHQNFEGAVGDCHLVGNYFQYVDGSRCYTNRKDAMAWVREIEKEGVAKIQINRDGTTRIYDLSVNDINAKAMAESRAKVDATEFIDPDKERKVKKIRIAVGAERPPGMSHTPGTPVMGDAMKSAAEIAKSIRPLIGNKAVKALIESAGDKDIIAVLRNRLGVANVIIQNLDEANEKLQQENVFLRDVIAGDSPADLWVSVEDKNSLHPAGELVNILFKNKTCCSGTMSAYRNGFDVGPGRIYYPMKYISHWQKIWYPNVTEEAK